MVHLKVKFNFYLYNQSSEEMRGTLYNSICLFHPSFHHDDIWTVFCSPSYINIYRVLLIDIDLSNSVCIMHVPHTHILRVCATFPPSSVTHFAPFPPCENIKICHSIKINSIRLYLSNINVLFLWSAQPKPVKSSDGSRRESGVMGTFYYDGVV